MGKLTRFGVSLDEELLEPFDALCAVKGYSNRSEAIRDLIRKALVAEEWHQADGQGAGTLTLVYDHHKNDLARRVRALADKLISCKGVKHGTFSGTTTGQDLA